MGVFGVRERRGTGRGAERDAERWGSRRVFPVGRAGSPRRVLRRGGCPIRFAVDAGSDGTRIGFEGTHVIVDLDENIAEVVQVRHQHVRIHRPHQPGAAPVCLGRFEHKLKGCRDCSGTLSPFVREGTPGVNTANDARGTFTHVRAARPSTLFPSPVHRDASRTREGVGGIHRRVRSSTRAPPSRDILFWQHAFGRRQTATSATPG